MSKIFLLDSFIIFTLFIFSLAIFGFQPWGGNNVLYVPLMEKLQNENLFPRDILFEAFKFHPSLFYTLIVSLSNIFRLSIKDLMVILGYGNFFVLGMVYFYISRRLFKKRALCFLFLIFLLGLKYSLAYEPIGINFQQATQTTFVLPAALLAIYFFIIGKRILSFFILGLIANFQVEVALQVTILFIVSQLLEYLRKTRVKTLIQIPRQIFYFFSGSFPIIWWLFNKNFFKNLNIVTVSPLWLKIIKFRVAHHFFPAKWGITSWLLAAFFIIIFFLAILMKKKKHEFNKVDRHVSDIMLAFWPIFLLVFFFSEIIPIPIIMMLEIFRIFVFFNFFCLLYASYYVYSLLKTNKIQYQIWGLFLACLLFLPTSVFYSFNFFNPSVLGPVAAFFIFLILIIINCRKRLNPEFFSKVGVLVILGFLSLAAGQRIYRNFRYWNYFTFDNSDEKEWREVQLWANNNTSNSALFVTPPNLYGFRVYSQRSTLGDYKDGVSLLYHPFLFKEWWQRMEDLGVKKEMAKGAYLSGYKELKDKVYIKKLAQKYKADFFISTYDDLEFFKVYNNNKFSVYKLN